MRISYHSNKKSNGINNVLKSLGDPKKWVNSIKRVNLVETPLTKKSKMLFNLYINLGLMLSTEKWLDVLLSTKEEVKSKKDEISI